MRLIKRGLTLLFTLSLIGAAGFFIFAPGIVERQQNTIRPHAPYDVDAAAQTLHDTLLIGDWHADTLLWNRDLNDYGARGHADFPRLIAGGTALQVFTSVTKTPAGMNLEANAAEARDNITLLAIGQLWPIRTWDSLAERALYHAARLEESATASGGDVVFIKNRADLDAFLTARAAGEVKLGALFGTEGGHPLEGDLANLDRLEAAGLRVMGLHHFFDNELGGSLHGFSNDGLTEFGRAVVREIEMRPIVLDLAHSSHAVVREVLEMTDMPLIVSHTGLYSHCPGPRNLPDDLMQAIAATGGVIGMGYWKTVSCEDSPDGIAASIKAAIEVLGADHISLGSDFDGAVKTSFDAAELPALTGAMLDAGISEADIRKVMGENMVRVLRARLE